MAITYDTRSERIVRDTGSMTSGNEVIVQLNPLKSHVVSLQIATGNVTFVQSSGRTRPTSPSTMSPDAGGAVSGSASFIVPAGTTYVSAIVNSGTLDNMGVCRAE